MNSQQIRNTLIFNFAGSIEENNNGGIIVTEDGNNVTLTTAVGFIYQKPFFPLVVKSLFGITPTPQQMLNYGYLPPRIRPLNSSITISKRKLFNIFKKLGWRIDKGGEPDGCDLCDIAFDGNEEVFDVELYSHVCRSCYDNYVECNGCNYMVLRDNTIITQDDDRYCRGCEQSGNYCYSCNDCGDTFSGDDYYTVVDDILCNSCYNDNYRACSDCGDDVYSEDLSYCEENDSDYCNSCWNDHSCDNGHDNIYIPHFQNNATNDTRVYNLPPEDSHGDSRPTSSHNPTLKFFKGKATEIINLERFVGVEIEAENGQFSLDMANELPSHTALVSDGSVNGVEINTPPSMGDKLEEVIKGSCEVLKKHGYSGTIKCGVHVHIDCRDIKGKLDTISQIVKTYYAVEDILYSMLPPSRWGNNYCKKLCQDYLFDSFNPSNKDVDKVWYKTDTKVQANDYKRNHHGRDRYFGLNVHSIFYQGTLELRYHSGTTSADKIINWIGINLRLFKYALENYDEAKMKELFDMPTDYNKFDKFVNTFGIPTELKKYMLKRISLFNPNWEVKFNKGKFYREIEKDKNEILNKIIEMKIKKETPNQLKAIIKQYQTNYGKNYKTFYNLSNLKQNAEARARDIILNQLPPEYRVRDKKVVDGGFITEEEIRQRTRAISRGMLMVMNREQGKSEDEEFELETQTRGVSSY
jgi:hypothetical protein